MIEIKDFSFSYGGTRVFDNINLEFRKGAVYGLLGENGVGKTTLLKSISGLLRPKKGTCTVDGMTSFDRNPEMLNNIYFLPDEVPLPDSATPESFFKGMIPFYPNADMNEMHRLSAEFHIDPKRRFKEMSFGQQKKALLSCALALNTEYLLLDEPTNGLDIPSKSDFRRVLSSNLDENKLIIISTHQVRDVENLIDPIVIIANNGVMLNASIEEITRRLYFEYAGMQNPMALYSEMMPGGFLNVMVNTTGTESQVNIEALFNTVLNNRGKIDNLFHAQNNM